MSTAHTSPLDRPVFLAGSGRCGSTLLQRLLNSSPEFLIWGEHSGFLSHLAAAYATAMGHDVASRLNASPADWLSREEQLRNPDRWTAWDNGATGESVRELFREFLLKFFAGPDRKPARWGFKEPRYGWTGDLALPFLHRLFPEARTVILIRDPFATIRSMLLAWYADERASTTEIDDRIFKLAEIWTRVYENLFLFHHQFPASTMLLRYEQLICTNTRSILADYLGADSPFEWDIVFSKKQDQSDTASEFAERVLNRLEENKAQLARLTCQVRAIYGYPALPEYDSVPYLKLDR